MLKRRKKVLLHGYDMDNLGDDLFFRVLAARYPDVQFVMPTMNYNYRSRFSDLTNLKIIDFFGIAKRTEYFNYKLPKLYSRLFMHRFDAVVYIGGSMFVDRREDSPVHQYAIRNYSFLCDHAFAAKAKVPCYLLGVNWGPCYHDYFYQFFDQAFNGMEDIFFRDRASYEIFKAKPQARCGGDILLGSSFISHAVPPAEKQEKQVAFSVISPRKELNIDPDAYVRELVRICREFIRAGYRIKLLSFCLPEGDRRTAEQILHEFRECPPGQITHLAYEGNWREMLSVLAESELVIASRFHAAILGWTFKSKVFSLLYSQKTLNLMQDCNITDGYVWLNEIEKINAEHILEHAVQLPDPEKYGGETSAFMKLDRILQ